MNTKERLQGVQAKLEQRGVQDVKFFFAVSAGMPLSHVETDVANALDAYLDGKISVVKNSSL